MLTYGARIAGLFVPDRTGRLVDVVAGYDRPDQWLGDNPYYNAVIGPVANRIGGARYCYDGREYPLEPNDGPNTLHGGSQGFDKLMWRVVDAAAGSLTLQLDSLPSVRRGVAGDMQVRITYRVDNDNALHLDYYALSTGNVATQCNLTNHAYFHLGRRHCCRDKSTGGIPRIGSASNKLYGAKHDYFLQ